MNKKLFFKGTFSENLFRFKDISFEEMAWYMCMPTYKHTHKCTHHFCSLYISPSPTLKPIRLLACCWLLTDWQSGLSQKSDPLPRVSPRGLKRPGPARPVIAARQSDRNPPIIRPVNFVFHSARPRADGPRADHGLYTRSPSRTLMWITSFILYSLF